MVFIYLQMLFISYELNFFLLNHQAVNVDSTDVSIWYKIGKLAEEIQNYPLARHAYETVNIGFLTDFHNFKNIILISFMPQSR